MAHFVFTDGFFSWKAVDLSAHCKSITLNYEADAVDDTMMGDTSEVLLGGVKRWSVEIEARTDEAAAALNATLFPDVGTTGTVIVRGKSDAVSATNPNYTGTGLLTTLSPLGGSHGEAAAASITIRGSGALSQATA